MFVYQTGSTLIYLKSQHHGMLTCSIFLIDNSTIMTQLSVSRMNIVAVMYHGYTLWSHSSNIANKTWEFGIYHRAFHGLLEKFINIRYFRYDDIPFEIPVTNTQIQGQVLFCYFF